MRDAAGRLQFGFRKRCAWCGVELRRWQRDCCRLCNVPAKRLTYSDPPCGHLSRTGEAADEWRWPWSKPMSDTESEESTDGD